MIYLVFFQLALIIIITSILIISICANNYKIKDKIDYAVLNFINLFIPNITDENKALFNGVSSIIISVCICGIYSSLFSNIFNDKVFFCILVIIPTIISFISINFVDLFIGIKRRMHDYFNKSPLNMADDEYKAKNNELLRKKIGKSQFEKIKSTS